MTRAQNQCVFMMKTFLQKGFSDEYVESKAYQQHGARVGLSFISTTIPLIKLEMENENGKS